MVAVTFYNVQARMVHLEDDVLHITERVPLWVVKHWNYSHKHDLNSRLSYLMSRVGKQGGLDWIFKEIKPYVYDYYQNIEKETVNKADILLQPYLEFRSDLKERMMQWQKKHSPQLPQNEE